MKIAFHSNQSFKVGGIEMPFQCCSWLSVTGYFCFSAFNCSCNSSPLFFPLNLLPCNCYIVFWSLILLKVFKWIKRQTPHGNIYLEPVPFNTDQTGSQSRSLQPFTEVIYSKQTLSSKNEHTPNKYNPFRIKCHVHASYWMLALTTPKPGTQN